MNPFFIPVPPRFVYDVIIIVKSSILTAARRYRTELEYFQSHISRELPLFDLSGSYLESSTFYLPHVQRVFFTALVKKKNPRYLLILVAT